MPIIQREKEAKLCPECPLRVYLPYVKTQSYTRTAAIESNIKLCARLRKLSLTRELGRKCPHFPPSERINSFLFPRKKPKRRRR